MDQIALKWAFWAFSWCGIVLYSLGEPVSYIHLTLLTNREVGCPAGLALLNIRITEGE